MNLQCVIASVVSRYVAENSFNGAVLEQELRSGMEACPGLVDQYGHPVFKKELIRYLLKIGELDQAEEIADGAGFFYVLLARHYQKAGQQILARKVWRRLLSLDPEHAEALTALAPGFAEDIFNAPLHAAGSDHWSDIGVYHFKNMRVSGVGCIQLLEHFQQNRAAVLRPEMFKNKQLENFCDSKKSGNSLEEGESGFLLSSKIIPAYWAKIIRRCGRI